MRFVVRRIMAIFSSTSIFALFIFFLLNEVEAQSIDSYLNEVDYDDGPSTIGVVVASLIVIFILVVCCLCFACSKFLDWMCCSKVRSPPIQIVIPSSTDNMMGSQSLNDKDELRGLISSPPSYFQTV